MKKPLLLLDLSNWIRIWLWFPQHNVFVSEFVSQLCRQINFLVIVRAWLHATLIRCFELGFHGKEWAARKWHTIFSSQFCLGLLAWCFAAALCWGSPELAIKSSGTLVARRQSTAGQLLLSAGLRAFNGTQKWQQLHAHFVADKLCAMPENRNETDWNCNKNESIEMTRWKVSSRCPKRAWRNFAFVKCCA